MKPLIMKLNWVPYGEGFVAESPFGEYSINFDDTDDFAYLNCPWQLDTPDGPEGSYPMADEAQAEGQQDFENRVNRCLVNEI